MFEGLVSCKSMSWCWFRYLTQATTTGVTTYPKDFDAEKKLISKFQIPTCVKYTKDGRLEANFPALDILEWKSHTPWDTWNLIAKMGDSRYQLLQDSFHQHEHYQWQLRTKNYPSAQYWFHHVLETREDLSEAVTFTVTSSVEVDSHSIFDSGKEPTSLSIHSFRWLNSRGVDDQTYLICKYTTYTAVYRTTYIIT